MLFFLKQRKIMKEIFLIFQKIIKIHKSYSTKKFIILSNGLMKNNNVKNVHTHIQQTNKQKILLLIRQTKSEKAG